MIEGWNDHFTKIGNATDLTNSVFPYWYEIHSSLYLIIRVNNKVFHEGNAAYQANVVMLLFAGTHNLENVLGNSIHVMPSLIFEGHAIRLLLVHPQELQKLRNNPKDILINNAIEEILRFCPGKRAT